MKLIFLLFLVSTLQACNNCNSECDYGQTSQGYLESKTLHIGMNGLNAHSKKQLYEDKQALENSWLKVALTPSELTQLVEKVDFKKQFVLVYSVGKRHYVTGKITMDRIRYVSNTKYKTSRIDTIVNIGVAGSKECNIKVDVVTFPFIVMLIERPKNQYKLSTASDGQYNFPDGCTTLVTSAETPDGTYLDSKTLHIGFNGLRKLYSKEIYETNQTLENSWLKKALTPSEMMQIINEVDFKKQFVLVYLLGERVNVTGQITMDRIRYTSDAQAKTSSIEASINIGSADNDDCGKRAQLSSFPFAIVLVNRPENGFELIKGHFAQDWFRGDCANRMAGQETLP